MTPRRWILLGFALPFAVVAVLVVLVGRALSQPLPDTSFASGFTETAFDGLAAGATQEEAEAALGRPMVVVCSPDGSEVWTYSERATGAQVYVDVSLRFGADGALAEKIERELSEEPAWPGRALLPPGPGGRTAGMCASH